MGKKTGAWSTTITYDAADINEQNLKQYDAIVLNSTTGRWLDDPNSQAVTDARLLRTARWLVERWHARFGDVDARKLLAADNQAAPTSAFSMVVVSLMSVG